LNDHVIFTHLSYQTSGYIHLFFGIIQVPVVHLGFASEVGDTLLQTLAPNPGGICTAKSPTFESNGTFDACAMPAVHWMLLSTMHSNLLPQLPLSSVGISLACFKHSDLPTTKAPNTGGSSRFSHTR